MFDTVKMNEIKPFVKWAGGKTQLLTVIRSHYPKCLGKSIHKYAEPFIGGGAVLFDLLNRYQFSEVYISDTNLALICTYKAIRDQLEDLLQSISILKTEYSLVSDNDKELYYYDIRIRFNNLIRQNKSEASVEIASLFIFLNKTCFNGLYRVNKTGNFNVPFGKNMSPSFIDIPNLRIVSETLAKVQIVHGTYELCKSFVDSKTFVYFDPPYRPLTASANFNSYTSEAFNDVAQQRLAEFFTYLSSLDAKLMLSNSDPKNTSPDDGFFDELYGEFKITRVNASRMINSDKSKRGNITELLIRNYIE